MKDEAGGTKVRTATRRVKKSAIGRQAGRPGRGAARKTPVNQALQRGQGTTPSGATLADLFSHRFPGGSMSRILLAAIECFDKKGFHASSTRDIARKAKLSPSAVYIHFRSKEEVLFAISLVAAEWARDRLLETAEAGGTPTERLRHIISTHVTCHASLRMAMYVANYEFQSLNAQQRRKVIEIRDVIETLLSDCLSAGIAAGEFSIANLSVTRVAILSLCVSVLHWYSPKGSLTPAAVGAYYADLVSGMVGVSGPASATA